MYINQRKTVKAIAKSSILIATNVPVILMKGNFGYKGIKAKRNTINKNIVPSSILTALLMI